MENYDRIEPEFLERCKTEEFQKLVKHNYQTHRSKENERSKRYKESRKKYSDSKKGKIARKRATSIRHTRYRELVKELDRQEKEAIRMFYVNCPPGYEVDHIIPISKGGKHHITNLQYLTMQENRRKGNRI